VLKGSMQTDFLQTLLWIRSQPYHFQCFHEYLVLTNLLMTQNEEAQLILRGIFSTYSRNLKILRTRITGNGPGATYSDLYLSSLTQAPHFSYLRSLLPRSQ